MADYVFIETAPHGMRYEVRCRKCGERYEEDLRPVEPGTAVALVEPLLHAPRALADPLPQVGGEDFAAVAGLGG